MLALVLSLSACDSKESEEVKENKLDEVRSDVLNLYNELH